MKMHFQHITYSNDIEVLYDELKQGLFAGSKPFTKRVVIVPTSTIKSWLIQRMGSDPDLGIFAGVDIHFLEAGLEKIGVHLGLLIKNCCEPTKLQLALAIEDTLRNITQNFNELTTDERSIWQPMNDYLGSSFTLKNPKNSAKDNKKLRILSARMAEVFHDYGRVGDAIFSDIEENDRWQKSLWSSLEQRYEIWNYPYRKLTTLHDIDNAKDLQLHLFAINQLTPLHHRYLTHIENFIPINHYVISPCQQFWSDIVSDKERCRMEKRLAQDGANPKQIEELENYLTDTNPLLANLGKLGRSQARLLETKDSDVYEHYKAPIFMEGCSRYANIFTEDLAPCPDSHLTTLKLLQTDLLVLKNPQSDEKHAFDINDGSIQVHAIPKASREIDVVYNLILETLIERDVQPCNIIVAAPNIQEYIPFIHSVFGAPSSQVPYHIMAVDNILMNPTIRGFLHLLSIANSRWEASKVLALFHNKGFQRRHDLKNDDINLMETIVEETGIRWGRDAAHRHSIFSSSSSELPGEYYTKGTWQHGFNRVLEGLTMFDSSHNEDTAHEFSRFCPFDNISYTQAESVGNLLRILEQLKIDTAPVELGEHRTLNEWTAYFKHIFATYFLCGDNEKDVEGERILLSSIEELERASSRIENALFPSSTAIYHLEKILENRGSHRTATNTQTVRFCSLNALGPYPADTIILMGMVDGVYPSADKTPSYHLMYKGKWAEELHPRIDVERYAFLECILSAKNQLIITYPSQCGGDTNELPASSLVNDLFHYLDSACVIAKKKPSQVCLRKHPLLPFHCSYFTPQSNLKNFSQEHYNAALAFYHQDRKELPSFLSSLMENIAQENDTPSTIPLSDMISFAKHPIRTFLSKSVGVYVPRSLIQESQDDDHIVCSPYQKAILVRKALKTTPESALAHAKKAGILPNSPFNEIETTQIYLEASQIAQTLISKGVDVDDTFTIEFNEKFLTPNIQNQFWYLPPLLVNIPGFDPIKITGRIENVHRSGLLLFVEDELKRAVEMWPQILVFCSLIDAYNLPIEKNIYFAKHGKVGEKGAQDLDAKELLQRFTKYFITSKNTPAPLMPQWISLLLKGHCGPIAEDVAAESSAFKQVDEYLSWLNVRSSGVNWTDNAEHWSDTAQFLFTDLASGWYPKSLQKKTAGKGDEYV